MAIECLAIGALAQRTGCNVETIRYYERIGLLPKPPRSHSGRRVYSSQHLETLTFIRRSRRLGFSLKQIGRLLALVDENFTCAEVQTIAHEHLTEVRGKIAELQQLETALVGLADQCSGAPFPDCPIVDALRDSMPAI